MLSYTPSLLVFWYYYASPNPVMAEIWVSSLEVMQDVQTVDCYVSPENCGTTFSTTQAENKPNGYKTNII